MNSTYKEICDCGAEYLGTDAGTHIKVDNVMCRVCLSCNSVIINKWHPIRTRIAELEKLYHAAEQRAALWKRCAKKMRIESNQIMEDLIAEFSEHTVTIQRAALWKRCAHSIKYKAKLEIQRMYRTVLLENSYRTEAEAERDQWKSAAMEIAEILDFGNKNEGTAHPWWGIVDSEDNFIVNGPFFSRESAERFLGSHKYKFSKTAFVYCYSGYQSMAYRRLLELSTRILSGKLEGGE